MLSPAPANWTDEKKQAKKAESRSRRFRNDDRYQKRSAVIKKCSDLVVEAQKQFSGDRGDFGIGTADIPGTIPR